jgi:hypothetical protein
METHIPGLPERPACHGPTCRGDLPAPTPAIPRLHVPPTDQWGMFAEDLNTAQTPAAWTKSFEPRGFGVEDVRRIERPPRIAS